MNSMKKRIWRLSEFGKEKYLMTFLNGVAKA
jgi:hypothetical protein